MLPDKVIEVMCLVYVEAKYAPHKCLLVEFYLCPTR